LENTCYFVLSNELLFFFSNKLSKQASYFQLCCQDPLRGGKDDLFDHVLAIVHSDDSDALAKDAVAPPRRRLVPEILLKIANNISPF